MVRDKLAATFIWIFTAVSTNFAFLFLKNNPKHLYVHVYERKLNGDVSWTSASHPSGNICLATVKILIFSILPTSVGRNSIVYCRIRCDLVSCKFTCVLCFSRRTNSYCELMQLIFFIQFSNLDLIACT